MMLGCVTKTRDGEGIRMKDMARKNNTLETRWVSFENVTGQKGKSAMSNQGMKGSPFQRIDAGETKTLLDVEGCGTIHRIWMTLSDRSPRMLRSMRIDMFWDNAETPAVSAPLGDFFCAALGILVPFENELFSSPEGRSFNCFIPMPFYNRANIQITNESDQALDHFFYDINFTLSSEPTEQEYYYFHAVWNRENPTTLGVDYSVLPKIYGSGRFIGMSLGVVLDPAYADSWWGEGEVKVYLDGDDRFPTLAGTGTEDYIGTGWGQGTYCHRYQGCLVHDKDAGHVSFYRFHLPDPVYFQQDCSVSIQQIGGALKEVVNGFKERGAEFQVITADSDGTFYRLMEDSTLDWEDKRFDDQSTWLNFLRRDDVSSIAYVYLDAKEHTVLP